MTEPAPATGPATEGDGLVATIRQEISNALGELFDSGEADVSEGGGGAPAPTEKSLSVAEVQRLARDEMAKAQKELAAKRQTKSAGKPAGAGAAGAEGGSQSGTAPPPAPHARGAWERFQHALWGEKE